MKLEKVIFGKRVIFADLRIDQRAKFYQSLYHLLIFMVYEVSSKGDKIQSSVNFL